jgi:hypothetical protein
LSLVGAAVSPAVAQAQGGRAAPKPLAAKRKSLKDSLSGEAREAFDRGVTLYTNRNFEGALSEFDRAYTLSKDPRLLFNMAIAERDLKRYSRALNHLSQELAEGEATLSPDEKRTAEGVREGLKQFTAPLTVESSEGDATVLVDGREAGKTPLKEPLIVDVGERAITVSKAGFLDATQRINISGGTQAKLTFTLEVSEKRGKLVVRAQGAPSALVFVDGLERGPAPFEGEVTAGKHTIEIRAKGFVTESRTETIEFKSTQVMDVTLRPEQGKVRVETDKSDNAIAIDGKPVGTGVWEGFLPPGGHQLVVTHDGMETYSSDLAVQTDQQRTVKITLKNKPGLAWYWYVVGGVVLAGGGFATYKLTRPKTTDPQPGTISPGSVPVFFRW